MDERDAPSKWELAKAKHLFEHLSPVHRVGIIACMEPLYAYDTAEEKKPPAEIIPFRTNAS